MKILVACEECVKEGECEMTRNPYKIVQLKDGRYAVEYKNYPHVGIPDSWGTKAHATAYMAALLGLTVDEMRRKKV